MTRFFHQTSTTEAKNDRLDYIPPQINRGVPPLDAEFAQNLKDALSDPKSRREIVEAIVSDKNAFGMLCREIVHRLERDATYVDSRYAQP